MMKDHSSPAFLQRYRLLIDRIQSKEAHPISVFEQAFKQLVALPPVLLRFSSDKENTPFTVSLRNEKVVGVTGPYRAFFTDICRELQQTASMLSARHSTSAAASSAAALSEPEAAEAAAAAASSSSSEVPTAARKRPAEAPLLLLPVPNAVLGVGSNRDMFVLNPAAAAAAAAGTDSTLLSMMRVFGRLIGIALRSSVLLSLDLAPLVWKGFVGEPITREDIESIDDQFRAQLVALEAGSIEAGQMFQTVGSDMRTEVELCPGGAQIAVTAENRAEFISSLIRFRVHEFDPVILAVRQGLNEIVPLCSLALFDHNELAVAVCGKTAMDIELLKRHCIYGGGLDANASISKWFWQVLSDFSEEQRSLFLEFTYAQRRLPSEQDFNRNSVRLQVNLMKLKPAQEKDRDSFLPHSSTCFFNLDLPPYSSKEVLQKQLLIAISSNSGFGSPEEEAQARELALERQGSSSVGGGFSHKDEDEDEEQEDEEGGEGEDEELGS